MLEAFLMEAVAASVSWAAVFYWVVQTGACDIK